jgi:hypothetical protein
LDACEVETGKVAVTVDKLENLLKIENGGRKTDVEGGLSADLPGWRHRRNHVPDCLS